MIQYNNKSDITQIVKKEKKLVNDYASYETSIKEALDICIRNVDSLTFDTDIFKTMIQNNLKNAAMQVENNLQDIDSLANILDILETQSKFSAKDVSTYNKLCSNVNTNIELIQKFLEKTFFSLDTMKPKGRERILNSIQKCKETILRDSEFYTREDNEETTPVEVEKTKTKTSTTASSPTTSKKKAPKKIKKNVDFSSSALQCFFPKDESDNLVISTVQENYKLNIKDGVVTIYIEDEGFNLSLKTHGIQISNANTDNILYVSLQSDSYTIITNNQIDIPPFIQISKIAKNDDFLEVEIKTDDLNLIVDKNIIKFDKNKNVQENSKVNTNNVQVPPQPAVANNEPIVYNVPNQNGNVVVPQEVASPVVIPGQMPNVTFDSLNKTIPISNVQQPQMMTPQIVNTMYQAAPKEITDNDTLIIADENKNVILPYKVSELEAKLKKNRSYTSLEDVIKKEYTIPIETFKNPVKSRFREAFQLIKKKEHGTLKEAVELGFELMFQSDLNPAVIAACKDLDELDIYLDCLDDNDLDKFSCFKIDYNMPPNSSSRRKTR